MGKTKKGNLVLSRTVGQAILLDLGDGREVKITLVDATVPRGSLRVRLAVEADQTVRIWREELDEDTPA